MAVTWLASNWMFFNIAIGVMALPILMYALVGFSRGAPRWFANPLWTNLAFLDLLLMTCYFFHQFEEHAFDIYGRRYPFIEHLSKIIGCEPPIRSLGTDS